MRPADAPLSRSSRIAVASRSFSQHPVLRAELLRVYPRTTFNEAGARLVGLELIELLHGHEAAIVGLERIDDALLRSLPELRCISKYGVGLDSIDLEALRKHHVRLGWTPGVNRRSVAELALGFVLGATRGLLAACARTRSGEWPSPSGGQLSGRTVGLIGLGNIGQDLALLLAPFGCRVLACDIADRRDFCARHALEPVELEPLLERSDVVSLHVPLTPITRSMIDRARLSSMRRGATLVNTARGEVVDEGALVSALRSGHIGAYCADVFAEEPPLDSELLSMPNVFATPHMGGSTPEAVLAMGRAAIRGLAEAQLPDDCSA